MTAEGRAHQEDFARFARDVIVNVFANVIAGAVVYLAGVAAGLFTGNAVLQAICWSLLLVAVALALLLAALRHRDERGATYLIVAAITLGVAVFGLGVGLPQQSWEVRLLMSVTGVCMAGVGVRQLFAAKRD